MATVFIYPLTDTVNDRVATDQLRLEIQDSAIATALDPEPMDIACDFADVTIIFVSDLSAGDVTTLTGLVAAHTGDGLLQLEVLQVVIVADLPTYAVQGWMAFVSDEAGGPVPAYFDGTNWRRVTDGAIVS